MMDAAERDAVLLHESISGLGTKDTALIGIVCTRTPSQLYIIKQAYYNLYHRTLEHAVDGDTSGNYQKLLLALLKGNRSEILGVDQQLAMADAHALYKAGEGRWGTNEDTFIHILATRSAAHLTTVSQYYLQAFGHSLEKVSSTSSVCRFHLISSQACSTCHHWMLGISTEFDLMSVPSDAFPN
jgi:hypothetical protein